MAQTTRSFQNMLNEYLTNDLMQDMLMKRDWLMSNTEQVQDWQGGNMPVPFQSTQASSVRFGGLTADTDIAQDAYIRGNVPGYVEVWSTLKWNHGDILDMSGRVKEDAFLKITPGKVDDMMQYTKELVSQNILNGASFAKVIDTTNAAAGRVVVNRIERFVLGQKVSLMDADTAAASFYVTQIVLDTNEVTLSASRGGAAADVSAYTAAQGAKFYHDGVLVGGVVTNKFTSLKESLLSAANGGTATLYGVSKLSAPYLQAINVDGSGVSATNVLEKIFDAYNLIRTKARGNANKVVVSYKHLGNIMKILENIKSPFKQQGDTKANVYGWTEIEITSVKGTLTVVGVQELDSDCILLLDMTAMKFFSQGMFKKRKAPDGKEYFEQRTQQGYIYLVDISLFGEFVLLAPSRCGIIANIPVI